jgi:hypothetical protein
MTPVAHEVILADAEP